MPCRTLPHRPEAPRKAVRRSYSAWAGLFENRAIDFMIRYSSYSLTNYRTNPSAPTELLCSLAKEYRELQDLRERVRKAEAAAASAVRSPYSERPTVGAADRSRARAAPNSTTFSTATRSARLSVGSPSM
jgi:hypothetical protein